MISFLAVIQKSLYECLKNDAALMKKINGVFDYVDDKGKFPYITIGESSVTSFDTRTFEGEESIETIHIWSRTKGKLETKEIIELTVKALNNLKLIKGNLQYFSIEDKDVVDDPDGKTRHGVIRIKIRVKE